MSRSLIACLVLATALMAAPWANAVLPDEKLTDPALEARARTLSLELRCPVCQNQSIDDSNAELARDLRLLVRERLVAGDSNEEALAFIQARYGDFVLLNPPVKSSTYLLWFGPVAILGLGLLVLFVTMRRRRSVAVGAELTAEERARLDRALAGEDRP